MAPMISVIVPVYNVTAYLRECLDSVLGQTFRDIQILCVNDGSTDDSRTILQEYAEKDGRIEIIDKANGGLASARNAALSRARGKYILFVDSDDRIEADLCQTVFDRAEETNADYVVFFFQMFGTSFQRLDCDRYRDDVMLSQADVLAALDHAYVWRRFWRSDFIRHHGMTFPEGLAFEDVLFCWMAAVRNGRVAVVPKILYHYRKRSDSITEDHGRQHLDMVEILDLIEKDLIENGLYREYRDFFLDRKLNTLCNIYYYVKPSLRKDVIERTRNVLKEEDIRFLEETPSFSRKTRDFYDMILNRAAFAARCRNFLRQCRSAIKQRTKPFRLRIRRLLGF